MSDALRSNRWTQSLRLKRRQDFRAVQASRARYVTSDLVVVWRRSEAGGVRFGLTVSKKVGNAVARNRVKRWLREVLRHHGRTLEGVDVVCIARSGAPLAGLARLEDQVTSALAYIRARA